MKLNQRLILKSRTFILSLCLSFLCFSFSSLTSSQTIRAFTPETLAAANGQNGAPAYVAVNGLVYDLTSVPEWSQGRHYCSGAIAGKDITFLWNLVPRSHQNPSFLKRFTVVGKIPITRPTSQTATPANTTSRPVGNPEPPSEGVTLVTLLIIGFTIATAIMVGWLLIRMKR